MKTRLQVEIFKMYVRARKYSSVLMSNVKNVNWIRTFPFNQVKALKSRKHRTINYISR